MTSSTPRLDRTARPASAWRSPGLWLCALLVGYMFFNAARSVADPAAFAETFGVPLSNPAEDTFVIVYAIRALFLALFGLALLVQRRYGSLALFVLLGAVMPIGDALLVAQRGGAPAEVGRHVVIVGILLLTAFLTHRWAKIAPPRA